MTFHIKADDEFLPGHYNMLFAFGKGESPITVANYENGILEHTIRAVGDVTKDLDSHQEGDYIYYRGYYGNVWSIESFYGKNILIISGGLGLAATRFLKEKIIKERDRFKKVISLYGSKSYNDLLYKDHYARWKTSLDFKITLDNLPDPNLLKENENFEFSTGLITDLIKQTPLEGDFIVFMCGPDPMVKFSVKELLEKGIQKQNIFVSLERHMKCSVGTCGHCMMGPFFVCKDGPIFN